ncbi:hypothetical protein PVL29_013251 [Vitis rotundifolia]|uniref:Uncharacterized protein n=1 Tax=Vitis rotundifolia TaxID=103349 RepID=A0AA38ZKX6_VITRO|nr:hypothetical protein PVL29_013251 [Vitis rotundifolia]
MVRTDSMSHKSAPQQVVTPKGQTTQMQPSPKVRSESFESVRTKLRESLADALTLVYQQQDKSPHMEKNSKNEATASVDTATDNLIQKTIREETSKCTVQLAKLARNSRCNLGRKSEATGSQRGSGIRSGLQQKTYGFSNGALNGNAGNITMQKSRDFEPYVQGLTNVGENPFELMGQVTF